MINHINHNDDNHNHNVTVEDKVAFLSNIKNYRFKASRVYIRETHMSWVFIVNSTVYKMKKPVSGDLFDYRTLRERRENCKIEFNLNKRLAPGVYKDVVPLTRNKKGALRIGGIGKPVEWLVKMKKLAGHNMLDQLLIHKSAKLNDLRGAANMLAQFYLTTGVIATGAAEYRKRLQKEISLMHEKLCAPEFSFDRNQLRDIRDRLISFLLKRPDVFRKRTRDRRILDAHGDLKPEHICLKPRPVIIDRLEFSKELRVMDVAEELAYLKMECEMLGDKKCGDVFIQAYSKNSGDNIPEELLDFYISRKAFIRSYLVARHVLDCRYSKDTRWLRKAKKYLELAERYLKRID